MVTVVQEYDYQIWTLSFVTFVNISFLPLNRVPCFPSVHRLWVRISGYVWIRETHSRRKPYQSHINSGRKIREFRPHYIRGPAQSHSSVERENLSGITTSATHKKYSASQHQRRSSDSTPTEYSSLSKSTQII